MAAVENPLLQDFIFPPYDVIEPNHICPAIETLLIELEKDLDELEKTVEPTWPGLVVPLEKIIDRLSVVWGIVNHLNSVKDCPQLRAAIQLVQPKKVGFQLKLRQSKLIYKAFKAIKDSPDWENLSDARKRVVDLKLKEAVLYGVSLEDTSRERFNEIEQELEKLAQNFEENILDATKNFEKVITDKREIEGLPVTTLSITAKTATDKGYENATAEDDGPPNNTPIIERVLELRLEKAKLLGLKNYAEVSLEMKMATVDKAKDLIYKLHEASWGSAIQDLEELRDYAREKGAQEANDLNQWDINFWSERLRESRYDFDEEELRHYFPLPKVMEGLFNLTKKLFGVDIEPANGTAPVWNKDVSFYQVKDSSNAPIAYFYFDPYSRPSEKRGGAWADLVVGRSGVCSSDNTRPRLPITNIVCNLTPPTKDKPSLMTIREVEAVFHEFGHALQLLLTKQDEGLVSGNQGIEWDAVEIPSLFMENWCYQRETILGIAKHYESGEPLPENTCLRILRARTFRAGTLLLRQLRYASVDLELHSTYVPGGLESIYDVDQEIGKRTHPIPLLPEDRFLCSFSHIFADKYAAGYYSYQWAEVLSADAFSAFEEAGLDNDQSLREMGSKFRETILALGGGKAPNEVFLEFRGREPTPDAFLRYNGLLPTIAAT
ncbi:hypothetical protein SASPL_119850 [Salvia splendens]|uniref:oligopeptidase A n=1 Tax=Salvia splendens TaxID=180675 RepID=A0A8X8XP32_SALSN|nr:hypothetical protein SASPL_119850 [Salvia splendens]